MHNTKAGFLIWAPVVSGARRDESLAGEICAECVLSQERVNHPLEFPIFLPTESLADSSLTGRLTVGGLNGVGEIPLLETVHLYHGDSSVLLSSKCSYSDLKNGEVFWFRTSKTSEMPR